MQQLFLLFAPQPPLRKKKMAFLNLIIYRLLENEYCVAVQKHECLNLKGTLEEKELKIQYLLSLVRICSAVSFALFNGIYSNVAFHRAVPHKLLGILVVSPTGLKICKKC